MKSNTNEVRLHILYIIINVCVSAHAHIHVYVYILCIFVNVCIRAAYLNVNFSGSFGKSINMSHNSDCLKAYLIHSQNNA